MSKKTGCGYSLTEEEWVIFRKDVYECLFYNDKKWPSNGQSTFFNGNLVHYSDFMKAKRGSL